MKITKLRNYIESASRIVPDKIFLNVKHKYHIGRKLNLSNPKSFSEKIHWLKLNYRKPEYSTYVDKFSVRPYISETIGEKYLIPLIGVYGSVDEIDWGKLPDKFVLKCTHGSGCNIICSDKNNFNVEEATRKLKIWLGRNWYWYGREWPYKNVVPKIICEEYMVDNNGDKGLTDYKFYCFNGNPTYCQVIRGRNSDETIDFYDNQWNQMEFTGLKKSARTSSGISKPENYEEMLDLSRRLSQGLPFVRVDLYYIKDKIYFGELTFYPLSGFGEFYPLEWNTRIGNLLELPNVTKPI